jgi:GrpB-like predicted nucleotidyltransferase (UPF0157 family)
MEMTGASIPRILGCHREGGEMPRSLMLASDPVLVVPYEDEWPRLFREQAAQLRAALGEVALRIDHIGSTSVPGLAAKPVIDVQISVAALEPVETFREPLEGLGYVFRANDPERTKRYFREPPGERRTHIHIRRLGSWNEQFALLFRDYLREHRDAARRYARLKRRLATRYNQPEQRAQYTDAKDPFIWRMMYAANLWAQRAGWEPGPSDA